MWDWKLHSQQSTGMYQIRWLSLLNQVRMIRIFRAMVWFSCKYASDSSLYNYQTWFKYCPKHVNQTCYRAGFNQLWYLQWSLHVLYHPILWTLWYPIVSSNIHHGNHSLCSCGWIVLYCMGCMVYDCVLNKKKFDLLVHSQCWWVCLAYQTTTLKTAWSEMNNNHISFKYKCCVWA